MADKQWFEDLEKEALFAIMAQTEKVAKVGGWEWDIVKDTWTFSDSFLNIHGFSDRHLKTADLMLLAHPDDKTDIQMAFEKALTEGADYEIEHRIVRQDTGEERYVRSFGKPKLDSDGKVVKLFGSAQDITDRKRTEEELKRIEWMLSGKPTSSMEPRAKHYDQGYGDLTELNRGGIILKSVGHNRLKYFAKDYLELLGTSSAIYEVNGDYAFGIFSSGWCRMLDSASRKLCDTPDNAEALGSGKWLCHESCWTDCSRAAIAKRGPVEIECNGGIRMYTVPIFAGENVVGAINFGYGDPPKDPEKLKILADLYHLNHDDLFREATAYDSRPPYIIEMAKNRLKNTATLIGLMVEKTQAMEALRESEEKHRRLFENMPQGVTYRAADGSLISANPAAERILGLSTEQMWSKMPKDPRWKVSREDGTEMTVADYPPMTALRKGKTIGPDILRVFHPDKNDYVWLMSTAIPLFAPGETKPYQVYTTFVDITSRKQAEEALRESENKFRKLFDSSPNAVALTEIETGRLIDANDKFFRLTQTTRDETLGRTTTELGFYSEDDRNRFISELKNGGKVEGLEMGFKRKDGANLFARMFAVPVRIKGQECLLTEFHNITEEKRLEAQLQQARQMEAIATLTGGIAHDYNNLMAIVMGNLSMAMDEAEPASDLGDFLNEANMASCKVRDLTHELMSLSRGGKPVKEVAFLNELLKSAKNAVPTDSGISVNESISKDLWQVPHDAYKMGAVFRNVVTNAVEAMSDGGTLSIRAENRTVGNQDPGLTFDPGDFVHISIQDQGKGIAEEQMDKIFEPYFSTKPRGTQKGMGLGLTTAYAIVKQHQGHFQIDSSPGAGTTVNIYLPAESGPKQMDSTIPSANKKTSPAKRVLVMDDEEMLRKLAGLMLERIGYVVETVENGLEAIETYKQQKDSGEPFDAVILDLTIKGGMGGEQTMRELLKIDPDVKAIVCSGYFNDPVMKDFKAYGFMGAIAKPYEKKALKEVLERLSE